MKKSLINPERVKQYLMKIENENRDPDDSQKPITIEADEQQVDLPPEEK